MKDEEQGRDVIELARPYGRMVLGAIFFSGGALVLANRASTNDRGLIINGIIHLEPGSADVFFAVLAMLSVGFVALSILAMRAIHRRKSFRIVIAKKKVTIPMPVRAWESRPPADIEIRYEDLISIAVSPVMIKIVRRDDKPVHLAKLYLPEGWTLRELADRIMARARARARADALAEKAAKTVAK